MESFTSITIYGNFVHCYLLYSSLHVLVFLQSWILRIEHALPSYLGNKMRAQKSENYCAFPLTPPYSASSWHFHTFPPLAKIRLNETLLHWDGCSILYLLAIICTKFFWFCSELQNNFVFLHIRTSYYWDSTFLSILSCSNLYLHLLRPV